MILTIIGLFVLLASKGQNLSLYGSAISKIGLLCFIAFIVTASEISDEFGPITFNFLIMLLGLPILMGAYLLLLGINISLSRGMAGHLSILGNGIFYILILIIFLRVCGLFAQRRQQYYPALNHYL